jgi:hypothetical protein
MVSLRVIDAWLCIFCEIEKLGRWELPGGAFQPTDFVRENGEKPRNHPIQRISDNETGQPLTVPLVSLSETHPDIYVKESRTGFNGLLASLVERFFILIFYTFTPSVC